MPGVYRPNTADTAFPAMLAASVQRLRGLESQQQEIISNLQGLPVLAMGSIIYSTGDLTQGIQFLDPTSGVERLLIGGLPDGTYGIQFSDPLAVSQDLIPAVSAYSASTFTSTSITPAVPTGMPAATAWIGPSADCFVTISALVSVIGGSSQFAFGYLDVDGTALNDSILEIGVGNPSASLGATVQYSQVAAVSFGPSLTPNAEHTFTLQIQADTNGQPVSFSRVSVVVQPI